MTVHFMCTCGSKTYSLPDSMAGQKVRCPSCQVIIIVPQPSEGGQVVIAVPADDSVEGY
ncbi:hypothetical protein [Candidatus Uabimicrobium sp. HlEnr_7]|uniref:hypothetical protein n=1 Tax=Candidatus Uabimicrobium helgolandensis TaxID=3095367 RepID=UPI003558D65C